MEYFYEKSEDLSSLKRIVPDTSAIIEGEISKIVENEEIDYPEIIIPEAVVAELEYQRNKERISGEKGLKQLNYLRELAYSGKISINFAGARPKNYEISLAKTGEIDAMVRDLAKNELATLVTCDKVQGEVAKAQGIPVIYKKQESRLDIPLKIAKYFDDETMSVHLKENVVPMAKIGKPGNIKLIAIDSKPITYEYLEKLAEDIMDKVNHDFKTYLEVDEDGATVVQSREFRISIAKPPFSEGMEITAVRPIAEVSLEEYDLSDKLIERLKNSANGILISGSPGAGKSTFAQAIAKFYSENMNKIVKTMESPRDLQVGDEITQYSPLDGDMEKTADILLLVRPDFTIYDELRKNHDFNIFADMRLAGVGMVGVVHATRPIDAIQRIAGRVELGIIPSIVDTTIYIENGEITAIYETELTVKVPTGMQEADLARPVIEVRDFETNELKNEIYTYGEQTIVMDVELASNPKDSEGKKKKAPMDKLVEREVIRAIKKVAPKAIIEVEILSDDRVKVFVNEKFIPRIVGRKGRKIDEIERKLGIHISLEPLENPNENTFEREDDFDIKTFEIPVKITKKQLILDIGYEYIGNECDILVNDEPIFTATVGKNGFVKIKQGLELSDYLLDAINTGIPIKGKFKS